MSDLPTPRRINRPQFEFTVPENARMFETDPHTVVMEPFTVGQELDAVRAAGAGGGLQYELLRRSVVMIDGKPVDQASMWVEELSPAVRTLLAKGLDRIVNADEKTEKTFFASLKAL